MSQCTPVSPICSVPVSEIRVTPVGRIHNNIPVSQIRWNSNQSKPNHRVHFINTSATWNDFTDERVQQMPFSQYSQVRKHQQERPYRSLFSDWQSLVALSTNEAACLKRYMQVTDATSYSGRLFVFTTCLCTIAIVPRLVLPFQISVAQFYYFFLAVLVINQSMFVQYITVLLIPPPKDICCIFKSAKV